MGDRSKDTSGTASQAETTSPANNGTVSLGLNRTANVIRISMTCRDEYAAIVLYDQLVSSAQQGRLGFSAASTAKE